MCERGHENKFAASYVRHRALQADFWLVGAPLDGRPGALASGAGSPGIVKLIEVSAAHVRHAPSIAALLHPTDPRLPGALTGPSTGDAGDIAIPENLDIPGYRLGAPLGSGGFGIVLDAIREVDGCPVAIKLAHHATAEAQARLDFEAQAMRAVGPPAVPAVHGQGVLPSGAPYMVLERLDILSLAAALAETDAAPISINRFAALADAIVAALEAVHAAGLLHRDLKPRNIFVSESPLLARLIDFGLATTMRPSAGSSELLLPGAVGEAAGTVMGTASYMAPEQCQGRSDLDARADVYSIGVVLFEMLTGSLPFSGSPAAVREAHISRRSPVPSRVADVPAVFDEVIVRCLHKHREQRWDSAGSLRRALAQAARPGGSSARARKQTNPDRPSATTSERRPVGLLAFRALTGTYAIHRALTGLGGCLAHVEGDHCAAVFATTASDNPVHRALHAARALISQNLASHALIDRERVLVRGRADGSTLYLSPAFRRRDRFPHTADARAVLLTATAADAVAELGTTPIEGHAELRQLTLASEPDRGRELVGRDQPLAELLDSARAAVIERRPTVNTLLAEPGYGKTHLSAALVAELRVRLGQEAQILALTAREPLGGERFATLRTLLRAALELPEVPAAGGIRELLLARLPAGPAAQAWPAVAMALGWLPADAPELVRLRAAPGALRSAALTAAGEALRSLAALRPLCIIIDDAHFADETALDALEYAALAGMRTPLWVCVLALPGFAHARRKFGSRAASHRTSTLEPLDADSAAILCRRLLHPVENVPNETIAELVVQTRGNPLLLVELIRGAKQHGLVRKHAGGGAWYLAADELGNLPARPQVEWLAERAVAALPAELAAHARLAALLGPEFTARDIDGILRQLDADGAGATFPLDARVSIQRLLAHGLLAALGEDTFGFRHGVVRDEIARSTPAELKAEIHRAAFRFYRDATTVAGLRLPRLAEHAACSGHEALAAAIYLDLARRAESRHQYLDAELMYSRALELLPGEAPAATDQAEPETRPVEQMTAREGRGRMRYRLGRYGDALDDLRHARAIARARGDTLAEASLLLDEATVLDWLMDFNESRALVTAAQGLGVCSPALEARLSLGIGRTYYRYGDRPAAHTWLTRAATQAEALGDDGYETLVIALLLLAPSLALDERLEEAQKMFDRVIELCEHRGDRLHLASALNNRREIWISLKDAERAVCDGLRSLEIGREIGQTEFEYATAYNLAEAYYYAGQFQAAAPHLERAVELEGEGGRRPLGLLLRARLSCLAGRESAARLDLVQLRAAQASASAAGRTSAVLLESETLLAAAVDLATGQADTVAWQSLLVRAVDVLAAYEISEVIELCAVAELRRGRVEVARARFREALQQAARTSHLIEHRIRRHLAGL